MKEEAIITLEQSLSRAIQRGHTVLDRWAFDEHRNATKLVGEYVLNLSEQVIKAVLLGVRLVCFHVFGSSFLKRFVFKF